MASVNGRLAKVMYGSVRLAGLSTWSMSGFTNPTLDDTEFGDTIQSFTFGGMADPGTVTFSGFHDPSDTNGQAAVAAAVVAGISLSNLYFYETTTKYWAVAAGGTILPTKCDSIMFEKNALATVSFEGKVSGAAMTAYGS